METMLVVTSLLTVLLDVLKELDGLLGCVEVLLIHDLLHLLVVLVMVAVASNFE